MILNKNNNNNNQGVFLELLVAANNVAKSKIDSLTIYKSEVHSRFGIHSRKDARSQSISTQR